MAERRWLFLWIALACGALLFASPVTPLNRLPFNPDWVLLPLVIAAIGLQTVGTMGMRAHLRAQRARAPIAITASFIAALAWGVAWLAAILGVAAGPGGLVYGLLIMLPAGIIGLALQIAVLIFFGRVERKLGRPAQNPL